MLSHGVLRRMRPQPSSSEDSGFTLIELVVAMLVMLLVMSAVLFFFVGTLRTVTLGKQRQTATALATQVMEQIRALPYAMVEKGIDSTDIVLSGPNADPNLSSATTFRPVTGGITETLVVTTPATVTPRGPLSPHVQQLTPDAGGPTYTVRSYVTQGSTPEQSYNLSVLVSWTSNVSNGPKTIIQRSVSYSPSGCLSTATHPFSGPCQALFSAQAGVTASGIQVADVANGGLVGLNGDPVTLALPGVSTSLGVEQITKLTSSVYTSTATANSGRSGGEAATAAADTDPSSTNSFTSSKPTAGQSSSPQTSTGTLGGVKVKPNSADTGKAGAMVAATGSICVGYDGTPVTNQLPCASGQVTASGSSADIVLEVNGGPSLTLGTAAGTSSRASAARLVNASGNCTGVGCSVAGAQRTVGAVSVGALPTGGTGLPAGYTSQFSVGAFTESLVVQAGQNQPSIPGALTRSTGAVSYWNGSGYSTIDLGIGGTATTAPVTVTYGSAVIEVESDVTVHGTSLSIPAPPTDCKTAVCSVTGTPVSTLVAHTTYTVTVGAQTASFVVTTDLGALSTRAAWQEAPDA